MRQEERLEVIFETATSMVTRTPEAWVQYLQFASRIYKYAFDNSLLVYAQDPNATMLATEEIWQRVGRTPKQNPRLIAVCEYHNAKNSLKYLLDISQTDGLQTPQQWNLDENGRTQLALRLSARYNRDDPFLNNVIAYYVHEALEQSFEQYMQDFELDISGHFFAGLPKDGLYQQMRDIIEASARIFIGSRCGTLVYDADVQTLAAINHFDTVPLAARLGSIVTDVSKHILLDIERTVKTIARERSEQNEQPEQSVIHRERWPAVPEHQRGERDDAPGQVRPRVDGEHAPEPQPAVHDPADDGQAGGNGPAGGTGGVGAAGDHVPEAPVGEPAPGDGGHTGENPPPEQPAPDGGGGRDGRDRAETEVAPTEELQEREPQGSFSLPAPADGAAAPSYDVGDVVDLEGAAYRIVSKGWRVGLEAVDPSGTAVVARSMSVKNFEEALLSNSQRQAEPSQPDLEPQPGYEDWSEPASAENAPETPGVPSDDVDAYLPQRAEPPQPAQEPQGSFSLLSDTYYTPNLRIPYHVGDVAQSRFVSAKIVEVTEREVLYQFDDEPGNPHRMERQRFELNLENGVYRYIVSGDQQIAVGPGQFQPQSQDEGIPIYDAEARRLGINAILTNTELYPPELFASMWYFYDHPTATTAEMADFVRHTFEEIGPVELHGDRDYRTELTPEGMTFHIGVGVAEMRWHEVAERIDDLMEDGAYPDPREAEADNSLEERIGSYNIPDELDEMNGAPDGPEPEATADDELETLYASVDAFLCRANELYAGWCEELADMLQRHPDTENLYDDFRDIEERSLTINSRYVDCFAFENRVTFRINEHDLDFTYPEIIQRIRVLMEIGDFAPARSDPQEPASKEPAQVMVVRRERDPELEAVAPTIASLRELLDATEDEQLDFTGMKDGTWCVSLSNAPQTGAINRYVSDATPIYGDFLIVRYGQDGGVYYTVEANEEAFETFLPLTDEDIAKYTARFTDNIRVLVMRSGEQPAPVYMQHDERAMRYMVDPTGYSSLDSYQIAPDVYAFCPDEVPETEPVNRVLPGGLAVRGDIVLARRDDDGELFSLTDGEINRYMEMYSSAVLDITQRINERQHQEREARERAEAEQEARGAGLEGELYQFQRAKGQPDFDVQEPPLDYNPDDFVEITDIPRFDEVDTFVPQPKVVDFQEARNQTAGEQISIFDWVPEAPRIEPVPDASFEADADDEPQTPDIEPDELDYSLPPEEMLPERLRQQRINYRFAEEHNLYPGGEKTKFRNNIEAIQLLKQIESENRLATVDEQKVLARYVGWGGIAKAFDHNDEGWQKEYQELKLLLTGEEYHAARESVLTAYYTDPALVRYLYRALGNFGFRDGDRRQILDPAFGTGNFYSVLPEGLENAKLTGIEIDSISGRIARQLYQRADVRITGFETSGVKNDSVDAVISNVPFNTYRIYDRRYEEDYLIHDYFIIRSLDALKPGGIGIFITSNGITGGSFNKKESSDRADMARRADLIGAIRLPSKTFRAIAGTDITTDIMFFKKRQRPLPEDAPLPSWVECDYRRDDGMYLNQYYIDHPEMMLGEMKQVSGRFGMTQACIAPEGQELFPLLEQAIDKLNAEFSAAPDQPARPKVREIAGEQRETIKAPDGIRNFTYHIQGGVLYYCTGGELVPQDFTGKRLERISGLVNIREALRKVIDIQSTENFSQAELAAAQHTLNARYDEFVKNNGPINSRGNVMAFSDDDSFPLLRSIEDHDKKTDTYSKAPIFSRATIRPRRLPDRAETALQALQVSLNVKQKVDIPFMARLYGKDEDTVIAGLGDKIYLNPQKFYGNPYEGWELDEEYLSGLVVDKLAYALLKAEDYPELFTRNVEALKDIQPPPLLPGDIEYSLGSPWIPIQYYRQFMYETFGTSSWYKVDGDKEQIALEYLEYTNQWRINNKGKEPDSVTVNQTYGTERVNAYEILEDTLNLQSVTVRDRVDYTDDNGKAQKKYVVNARETMIARGKQQMIRDAFKGWLFAEAERADPLMKLYNDKFNNIRPRTYDGSHLMFPGMSDELELRPHQLNVAARIIYNGTALMAHEVGAGKTAAMIAAGMYMKHYGIVKKPIYVVPNHIIEQWTNEFLRFFPAANLLVTTERDFDKKNRQQFVSKIAMGEYDGIIISHSQFEKIMVSPERQEKLLTDQINRLTYIIDQIKQENGEHWTIKNIVIFQKSLKTRLERLANIDKKDALINFEELGLDYMFVDEAHQYKNNFSYSKIRNVAGFSNSASQRAADMKLKCEYLQETYNGRGVTFATGTPISNSIAELFIMQMFLQPHEMKQRDLDYFDNWAATFAQIVTALEITPEGTGYRVRSRFAKFHNLPELMNLFWLVADIQTEEMLGLPTPDIEGGKPQAVQTESTPFQKEVIQSYVKRSEAIRNGSVKPDEDNMLKLTHEARLLAIDPRLLYADAPNDPDSKLNVCIRNVFDIWQETAEKRLTQILFCDSGTPKAGVFNIYDETKSELIRMGVPAEEIAFIHDCKTDAQREALFEKVRAGDVRVLLGSTQKMGMGTNVQDRLYAIHHLDCPWRPTDITQRNGRGKRQGNMNPTIRILNYVTKGTFDSYLWQIQEQKLRYISQVMTGKSISRDCEDVDITVLNAAEVKAIATDNPLLLEKMTAENEVTRLSILHKSWLNEQSKMQRNIDVYYPQQIKVCEEGIEKVAQDLETLAANPGKDFVVELEGRRYDERAKAAPVLQTLINVHAEALSNEPLGVTRQIGSYRGLEVHVGKWKSHLYLKGAHTYEISLGNSDLGNITRLENRADKLAEVREDYEKKLKETHGQLQVAQRELGKPFQQEQELAEYSQRLMEINTKLEFKELADQDAVLEEQGGETGDQPPEAEQDPDMTQ